MSNPAAGLQPAVHAWIESTVGMPVSSMAQIPAGGRLGFFVDVEGPGERLELFLQSGRGIGDGLSSFQGFEVEAEVYRALAQIGVPVPKVWGLDRDLDVLLVDRMPGSVWFQPPADPDEQVRVAQDFIRHLATWHRAGAAALELPSFGPVLSWKEHQQRQLDGNEAAIAQAAAGQRLDPLVSRSLAWLRANIPDAEGPVVLVQGDTGPGNFLYQDGRVTAVIDWELAHLGDPMDDIAWLSWRATQHSFTDFPARLREYEELSGVEVDPARVRYYRLNAFGRLGPWFGLASMGRGSSPAVGGEVSEDRAADGSWLVLSMLHRRMRLAATADAMGLETPAAGVDEGPEPGHAHLYDRVLDQLRSMVPRIEDRRAASSAKAVARQVKYLKELDRNGGVFAAQELDDLGQLLGAVQSDLPAARGLLVDAVHDAKVSFEDYLDYHWRRLRRDDHLLRHASGALYERGWPPLR